RSRRTWSGVTPSTRAVRRHRCAGPGTPSRWTPVTSTSTRSWSSWRGGPMADPAEPPQPEARRPADTVRAAPVDVHPPTRLERVAYGVVRALVVALTKIWFRLEIVGRDKVPTDGPFVLAPVHRSNIDFLLV